MAVFLWGLFLCSAIAGLERHAQVTFRVPCPVQVDAKTKAKKGASAPGFMYEFPWERMGSYKYALFLPFLYVAATGQDDADDWCYHMCVIAVLRYVQVDPSPAPCTLPDSPSIFLHMDRRIYSSASGVTALAGHACVTRAPAESGACVGTRADLLGVCETHRATFGISCHATTTFRARPGFRTRG